MQLQALQELVHKTRDARRTQTLPKYTPAERDTLIKKHHPDYRENAYRPIKFGPNAGDKTVRELAALLEGDSPVSAELDLTPTYSTDVLVVGGGGAGCAAALHAHAHGAQVLLATKLRLGDSNTVMAQGGIQIAITKEDSPVQHFLDTLKGGHMQNDHRLLKTMVEEGPTIAKWLLDLGVLFDRDPDGNLHVKKGGGSSKPRLLTCSDYTGLEIMRVLKDEVLNQKIQLLEFSAAVELQSDTFQYHPTGAVHPEQLVGALVTEGIRSEGGHLVNAKGERFVNELDTRDVVSSSIIRECEEGRGVRTVTGRIGVWLDTPLLDVESGPGTLEKHFPAMVRQYKRYGLDITKDPVLIYPTLHYQNGGVQIDVNSESGVRNLFVAGEASGGLHGRNRLMGNSLLDLM